MSAPQVKKFSKEFPCTKIDIFNCFRTANGWRSRQIAEAHSEIGRNVPRRLVLDGRAEFFTQGEEERICLTEKGATWLYSALLKYLMNNPDKAGLVQHMPRFFHRKLRSTK